MQPRRAQSPGTSPLGSDSGDSTAGLLVDIGESSQNCLGHRRIAHLAGWAGPSDHVPILRGIPSPTDNVLGVAKPPWVRCRTATTLTPARIRTWKRRDPPGEITSPWTIGVFGRFEEALLWRLARTFHEPE
jgi:hypothetical protein